jgi:hypothetical protein
MALPLGNPFKRRLKRLHFIHMATFPSPMLPGITTDKVNKISFEKGNDEAWHPVKVAHNLSLSSLDIY